MNSLLKSAFKTRLTSASLWALPMRQRARENYRLFTETKTHQSTVTVKSLLIRIYYSNQKIILYQFVTAITAVIFHYANPFFLKKLLNYIQENHSSTSFIQQFENELGYMYCLALFGCNVVSTLVASQTLLWGRRWHVTIIHMLNSEIYAHALKLKTAPTKEESINNSDNELAEDEEDTEDHINQQASLMSQDTERLAELASYLHVTSPAPQKKKRAHVYFLLSRYFIPALWKLQLVFYFFIRF